MDVISEKLKLLPENPGVYIMLDEYKNVIYVGKARVLKNRVRQYFHNTQKPEKVMKMVENIRDFNYIITKTEIDALALENSLIKKYKPKYNILLKDDKTYPYIKVDLREDFPNFTITRKIKKDGCRYFGPFMGGINCGDILQILQLTYNVRQCRTKTNGKKRECLNYHIGICAAPCAGKVSKEDYAGQVKKALAFLDGNYKSAEQLLKNKMLACAAAENFELALDYKNKLAMLSKLEAKRITTLNKYVDADIIAYASNGLYSAVNVLVTRKGIMQGGSNYALDEAHMNDGEALTAFITQYYSNRELPSEIICEEFCEKELIQNYFKEKFSKSVEITVAKLGDKARLLKMAKENADDYLEKSIDKIKHKDDMTKNACKHLQEQLSLTRYPRRMECYDISNIQGVDKVASMVVFINGEPQTKLYRRFKIKTVEGANDFASMAEVISRRLAKIGDEQFGTTPDLIVIDGGLGQLGYAQKQVEQSGYDIELISLAKREEEVFTTRDHNSIMLPRRSYALNLLINIRDEAHRFAITYFRNLHLRNALKSELEKIDGIGDKRQKLLFRQFKTIENIQKATVEQLMETGGLNRKTAENVFNYFHA